MPKRGRATMEPVKAEPVKAPLMMAEPVKAEPVKAPLMIAEAALPQPARDPHRQLAPRSRPLPGRALRQPLLPGPRSSPFHIR